MKPKSFDYKKPAGLDEALQILDDAVNAKILAGGQSLVPMMNMRLAQPDLLVDINDLRELSEVTSDGTSVHFGALARHQEVLESPLVNERLPMMAEALKHVAHRAVRNRGTIGGSLVHNDPSAELGVVMRCLRADVVLMSLSEGERVVPLSDFFVTTFLTDIKPTEILTEIRVPVLPPKFGWAFKELTKRSGDFAIVDAACTIGTDASRRITDVSLALGGAAERPEVIDLSTTLVGKELDADLLQRVADNVRSQIDPQADNVASGDYKKHLAGELAKQCVSQAYDMSVTC